MSLAAARTWSVLAAAAVVACGLDATGTGPGVGGGEGTGDGGSSSSGGAACADGTCARSEPDWAIVSVAPGASAACSPGWGNPRVLVSGIRSEASTCACTCGAPAGNPCAGGTANAAFRNGVMSCNDGTFTLTTDGTCQAIGFTWNDFNGVALAPPAVANVACAATAQLPAVVDDGALALCDLAGATGACTDGACVKTPGASAICLLREGEHETCPAGYPSRRVVAPPSGFSDTRTCGTCACATNATTCTAPTIGFYTNAACNQGGRSAAAMNACSAISGTGTPTHYRYVATADGSCVPATTTVPVTGAVTLTGASTLCCP